MDGSNSASLLRRLHAASLRVIAANGLNVVGRDGRVRYTMEPVKAEGALAALLREISGEIPQHADDCAARLSPIAVCDCSVLAVVRLIEAGE